MKQLAPKELRAVDVSLETCEDEAERDEDQYGVVGGRAREMR